MIRFERVRKIVADNFGIEDIKPADVLVDIHPFDDLDMQFLIWDLEEEFDIVIDNMDELKYMAIGEIVERLGELSNDKF